MPRFLVLPFYMGCLSQSTTGEFQWKRSNPESNQVAAMEGERESSSMVKNKKSWSSLAPSRSNISRAMDRLIRATFKSFTHIFAYKDVEDIKVETEMEIGFPTDVKHVTHIGYDGSMTTNLDKNIDQIHPSEMKHFELAMTENPTGLSPFQM